MNRTVLTTLGVFLQSFLLWWVSESAAVPLIAVGLVTLQRLFRLRWPRKPRASWLWASAFMLVALAVFLLSTRGDDGEFALATLRLPIAHCLLLAQVLVLLHQSPSDSTPGWFPGVALATCFLAFHQTVAPQQQALFLLLAIACVLCFGSLYQTTTRSNHAIDSQPVSLRRLSLIAVLITSALGAYAVAGAWEIAVANVQAALPMWAARAGHSVRTSRGYVRTGVLGSITLEKQNDPMHVALRVYATKTPGYLRGRVFETYYRSQWRNGRRRGKWNRLDDKQIRTAVPQPPAEIPWPEQEQSTFAINTDVEGPFISLQIHNDPKRGEVFFTPLATGYLQGRGAFVAIDSHHMVHAGLQIDAPYTAHVAREARQIQLDDDLRRRLLTPPHNIDVEVENLAEEVCRGADSPQEKIEAVASFFQSEFTYATEGTTLPGDVDPLSFFLLNRPAAHCEFFASGAVTLLRFQGVPSRYVTGYVVTELEGEYGDYWLARNRDAHAWAEAYDETRRRWVVVEATPGMSVPRDDVVPDAAQAGSARGISRGVVDMAAKYPWLNNVVSRLTHPLVLCIAPFCSLLIVYYRLDRSRRSGSMYPHLDAMQLKLARLERRLRRRKHTRRSDETLHQFAQRLQEESADDEWLACCSDWYVQYARARYAGKGEDVEPPPLRLFQRRRSYRVKRDR